MTTVASDPSRVADSALLSDVATGAAVLTVTDKHRGAIRPVAPGTSAELPLHATPAPRFDVRLGSGATGGHWQQQPDDRNDDDDAHRHAQKSSSTSTVMLPTAVRPPTPQNQHLGCHPRTLAQASSLTCVRPLPRLRAGARHRCRH